jgi:pyruvate dehydrogenase E2 component (dihydrolipoamide acetyltransferase)
VAAAPSVRRLAREIGVDIAQVPASGPGGRISAEDVKAHSKTRHETRGSAAAVAAPLPDFSQWGEIERQPMSKVRQITAERLVQAWTTIPMVTQFDKADISDLEKWRKQYSKKAEKAGGKLTPTAILIKILGAALKTFPQFNASIDIANNEIVYKKYCNIGIAVDTPHGLMVPVMRDVDKKNIIELAVELGEMAQKTRERKIGPADMRGGSMTISNVGVMGGTAFTPIVNPPEVAILGVARSSVEPTYIDGELEPRTMMPLSLSYDHRVIDGADGARFLRWVCEALQNPFVVLLEG